MIVIRLSVFPSFGEATLSAVVPVDGEIVGVRWAGFLRTVDYANGYQYSLLAEVSFASSRVCFSQSSTETQSVGSNPFAVLAKAWANNWQTAAGGMIFPELSFNQVDNFPVGVPVRAGQTVYVHAAMSPIPAASQLEVIIFVATPEPRGSDVSKQSSLISLPRLGAIVSKFTAADDLKKRVLRADKAVECCERQVSRINVEIGALFAGLLSALQSANGENSLALVPVGAAVGTRGVASVAVLSEAALVSAALSGAVLLAGALELYNLSSTKASFDTLTLALTATQNYFAIRSKTKTKLGDCEDCVRRRLLDQSGRRQRQRVKILRRL